MTSQNMASTTNKSFTEKVDSRLKTPITRKMSTAKTQNLSAEPKQYPLCDDVYKNEPKVST